MKNVLVAGIAATQILWWAQPTFAQASMDVANPGIIRIKIDTTKVDVQNGLDPQRVHDRLSQVFGQAFLQSNIRLVEGTPEANKAAIAEGSLPDYESTQPSAPRFGHLLQSLYFVNASVSGGRKSAESGSRIVGSLLGTLFSRSRSISDVQVDQRCYQTDFSVRFDIENVETGEVVFSSDPLTGQDKQQTDQRVSFVLYGRSYNSGDSRRSQTVEIPVDAANALDRIGPKIQRAIAGHVSQFQQGEEQTPLPAGEVQVWDLSLLKGHPLVATLAYQSNQSLQVDQSLTLYLVGGSHVDARVSKVGLSRITVELQEDIRGERLDVKHLADVN